MAQCIQWYQRMFFAASYEPILVETAVPKFMFTEGYRRLINPNMDMAAAGRLELSVAQVMIKRVLADCVPEAHPLSQEEEELIHTYLSTIADYRQERIVHGEDATRMPPWETQTETQRNWAGLVSRQDMFPYHGTRGPQTIEYVGHVNGFGSGASSGHRGPLGVYRMAVEEVEASGRPFSRHEPSVHNARRPVSNPHGRLQHGQQTYHPPNANFALSAPPKTSGQLWERSRMYETSSEDSTPTPTPRPQAFGRDRLQALGGSTSTPVSVQQGTMQQAVQSPPGDFGARSMAADWSPSKVTPIGSELRYFHRERKQGVTETDENKTPTFASYSTQVPTTPSRRMDSSDASSLSGSASRYSSHPAFSPESNGTRSTHSSGMSGHDLTATQPSQLDFDWTWLAKTLDFEQPSRAMQAENTPTRVWDPVTNRRRLAPIQTTGHILEDDSEDDFILGPWAHRKSPRE